MAAEVALQTASVAPTTTLPVLSSAVWLATANMVAVATSVLTPVALASRALLRVVVLQAFVAAGDSGSSVDAAPDAALLAAAASALAASTVAGRDAGTAR